VFETGRPALIDNLADATGPLAEDVREDGVRSAVATWIVVEDRLWGLMAAASSRIPRCASPRIERDLHDGTQQQLVTLMLELRAA
jgi:hypothetical protein